MERGELTWEKFRLIRAAAAGRRASPLQQPARTAEETGGRKRAEETTGRDGGAPRRGMGRTVTYGG
jgi:hypothetical protein